MLFLKEKIGDTYQAATAASASDANLLDLDLSEWGGNRDGAARRRPTAPRGCAVEKDGALHVRL